MFILQTLNPQWNEEFIFRVSNFRLYYCILDVESDVNRFGICRNNLVSSHIVNEDFQVAFVGHKVRLVHNHHVL